MQEDKLEALEQLKEIILAYDLPRTEMTLFGIKCPYCGKSDRIRRLESVDELAETLSAADGQRLVSLARRLMPDGRELGVCKFCLNPVRLSGRDPARMLG